MPKLNKTTAKKVNQAEGLGALEPGMYLGCLNKVEDKEGANGTYWSWEFSIVGDSEGEEFKGGRIWENTSLSEKALWRLKDMFAAFDVEPDTDTDDLLGQYVWLNIGTEVQTEGAKKGQNRNILLGAFSASTDSEEAAEDE